MTKAKQLKTANSQNHLNISKQLGILDTPAEEAFDRLTRLASKLTNSPISMVNLIDSNRQFCKSAVGVPEPVATARETPLEYSFCKHVVESQGPMIIEDVSKNPLMMSNLAIPAYGIKGYLGMPLKTAGGETYGSFCVLDLTPRQWTQGEIGLMRDLSEPVMTEIELRAEVNERRQIEATLKKRNSQYKRIYRFAKVTIDTMKETIKRGTNNQEILVYLDQMETQLKRLNS